MSRLTEMLSRHEDDRLMPYLDDEGNTTIGTGRNLSARGISEDERKLMLQNDEVWVRRELSAFSFWAGLDEVRQDAIADLYFNIGKSRFLGFAKLIAALNRKDWDSAASEMLNSKWAAQVKGRAVELAAMVKTGEYQS